jgi:glycosyltransferase involved in cell wall biosynthesis
LKNDGYTHLHAHFVDRAAIVAFIASKLLKIPYSLTAHAADIYVSPVMLKEKIMNAKFVTTCTKYNKAYLENHLNCKINLIYHGIDLEEKIEFKNKYLKKKKIILSIGQLKEKKGFKYLIKACEILKDKNIDFYCEIIGEGPERENLETLIKDLHLKDFVCLKGAMTHKKVMEKFNDATIFVLSCVPAKNMDRDGIPNVLLEAMLNSVPVISTKFSGIPEVIQNGINGLLVDPEDYNALAESIVKLLASQELRKSLASSGKKIIKRKFDINKNTEKLFELFNYN